MGAEYDELLMDPECFSHLVLSVVVDTHVFRNCRQAEQRSRLTFVQVKAVDGQGKHFKQSLRV